MKASVIIFTSVEGKLKLTAREKIKPCSDWHFFYFDCCGLREHGSGCGASAGT